MSLTICAPAKINLTLDVTGTRPDGYHLLRSVMQSVSLADELTLTQEGSRLQFSCSDSSLPADERNLAVRAAQLMTDTFSLPTGIAIRLEKQIPVGAGLAGGSTDAAAIMLGMVRMFELAVRPEELERLGLALGADIPFCLRQGTALAEGIGEKLTAYPTPKLFVLLVKPPVSLSTAEIYRRLPAAEELAHPQIDGLLSALSARGNILDPMLTDAFRNVLEDPAEALCPQITVIKGALRQAGAAIALMSGSGSTVFGLFPNAAARKKAADTMRARFTDCFVFEAETICSAP